MNRRNFIGKALAAAAGFAVLPSAATYARRWAGTRAWPHWDGVWRERSGLLVPDEAARQEALAIIQRVWIAAPASSWDVEVFTPHQTPLAWWCSAQFSPRFFEGRPE